MDQIDNPTPTPISRAYTMEWDTSYTKTVNVSAYVNGTYTSELSALFGGLGAKINSQLGAGVTGSMGRQWSETLKTTKSSTWGPVCCAEESLFNYALYSSFSGSLTWYYDDALPAHFTVETLLWSAIDYQGTGTRVQLDRTYSDPPCPEPTSWLLLAGGGVVLFVAKSRTATRAK